MLDFAVIPPLKKNSWCNLQGLCFLWGTLLDLVKLGLREIVLPWCLLVAKSWRDRIMRTAPRFLEVFLHDDMRTKTIIIHQFSVGTKVGEKLYGSAYHFPNAQKRCMESHNRSTVQKEFLCVKSNPNDPRISPGWSSKWDMTVWIFCYQGCKAVG